MASELPPGTTNLQARVDYYISQQQTQQHPVAIAPPSPIPIMPAEPAEPLSPPVSSIKQRLKIFIQDLLFVDVHRCSFRACARRVLFVTYHHRPQFFAGLDVNSAVK